MSVNDIPYPKPIDKLRKLATQANDKLEKHFGEPEKKTHSDSLNVLILTVLSQSTSDHNRDLAFSELKRLYPTWEAVASASWQDLAKAIKSGGLANQKAKRILDILAWLKDHKGGYNLDWIRDISTEEAVDELTSLKGVGIKTAAVLLCFSFDAVIFPVDVHIHRICRRLGLVPVKASAEKTHHLMQPLVPDGRAKTFHLNLLKLGRTFCRPTHPGCEACPINGICEYYMKTFKKN